jgi:ribosomal protein S6
MSKNNETIVDEVSIDDRDLRVYEVSYLLVPTMTEDKAQAKSEDIKKSIATLGGSFIS